MVQGGRHCLRLRTDILLEEMVFMASGQEGIW